MYSDGAQFKRHSSIIAVTRATPSLVYSLLDFQDVYYKKIAHKFGKFMLINMKCLMSKVEWLQGQLITR